MKQVSEKNQMLEDKKEWKTFLLHWRSFFAYCLVGALATALETFLYWLFYEVVLLPNLLSTFIAWFLTIIFCFFTNKCFVYRSKTWEGKIVLKELVGFYSCRISTGLLNMVFMYVTVDVLALQPVLMKLAAAVMVGIINYLVGQLLVFRKKH